MVKKTDMVKKTEFNGPLFIVGMPRSGTKLFRDLLNNHSKVGIPPNESHIIPYFYNRFDKYMDIHCQAN
ncbi:MAG: sulfotransferase, partial [Desulfobacteraceae bacterium]|nr:sulfotransferase [Desulfobacteraceae bacterium]